MPNSETGKCTLGIDIGSVSFGYVLMDQKKQILKSDYLFHHGNIHKLLDEVLEELDWTRISQVAYNHASSEFFASGISVNEQVAFVEGVLHQRQMVRNIFVIGGETFGLILFDDTGHYQKYISNSLCAAGTGAFLDQQAERLGLSGSAELARLADSFEGDPPKIATRCSVFAKTDLIHCQQQGHSIEGICAGLCKGLAHNIADTLIKGVALCEPIVVVGGVSQNSKVMHYLAGMIGHPTLIPEYATLAGAIGCALIARNRSEGRRQTTQLSPATLLKQQSQTRHLFFAPLSSSLSVFPDFAGHTHCVSQDVELDFYNLPSAKGRISAYLGIDIGSTSTKAVVMDLTDETNILLGLYTKTAGQPIKASQALFRVLREIEEQYEVQFEFSGVGTTGSGRHFIQKVVNADLAIDEITAHARAAYALNPAVDTIIEIGGQDSKFTVMKEGRVTFAAMNYVCAAGTGSFIEEQAKRLDVPLGEYAGRALGTASPLTSDRCTVFMERDLNHYLSQGYSKNELLAAALHSIRDNYLSKVAHLNKIGNVICFQGATAKNKALVAAFEQKLQKPVFVSRYCHLTGALGVCLLLKEKHTSDTHFRGIDFYKESPRVAEEVCELCKNHCKLKRIQIAQESIMWGFMCGRDETTRKPRNRSGFDLLGSRQRVFNPSRSGTTNDDRARPLPEAGSSMDDPGVSGPDPSFEHFRDNLEFSLMSVRHRLFAPGQEETGGMKKKNRITIGIPAALQILDYVPFWRMFFEKLGYNVHVAASRPVFVEKGKEVAGAEFCTPLFNWHGLVHELSQHSDFLFLPNMFEGGDTGESKFYCYYSGYSVALVRNIRELNLEKRCFSPIIDFSVAPVENVRQIYESLPEQLKFIQTPWEIREAYLQAWRWLTERRTHLVEIFRQERRFSDGIAVVFLGRPYVVLDPVLNQRIPQKFNDAGVKTFFQDMLPYGDVEFSSREKESLDWNHWKYGSDILRAAAYIAQSPGLYPVYLSAFKCSPDSFLLAYVKEIMDTYRKPYLMMQIDEHGSDVGYGTRVESAIETFRHHFRQNTSAPRVSTTPSVALKPPKEGTILIPNYDSFSCSLICAAFEHAGYRARLIEESATTISSSLRLNDGQCLPVSSIAQGAMETIHKYNLDPGATSIFINAITKTACNLPQYPLMLKKLLEQRGHGFEKVQVSASEFKMTGFPFEIIYEVYCSYLFGGLVRRIGCKLRPYELLPGQTDRLIEEARMKLYRCIADGVSKEAVFRDVISSFAAISMNAVSEPRPKAAIIGDLYVRDNDVFNQQLISELEKNGAEVVTIPFNYILRILARKHAYHQRQDGHYVSLVQHKLLMGVLETFEKRFFQIANVILDEEFPTFDDSLFENLHTYGLVMDHCGETIQNVLKIFSMLRHYPDLSLFIHVNPIFCCPGLVSESIFKAVEKDIGIPIVSIVYDGTTTRRNDILTPYMHYLSRSFSGKATLKRA